MQFFFRSETVCTMSSTTTMGVRGYARVCVGMRRGAQCERVCASVCKSVWMSASVCMG